MTNIPANVEEKLAQLPKVVHTQLLALRALILEVAAQTPQVGSWSRR